MLATPIISTKQLLELRDTGATFRLIDARAGGRHSYVASHLVGARYADLDSDLAAPVHDAARGGRHPLPEASAWVSTLRRLGIEPNTPVVVYDAHGGALAAARLWWMLRASGHAAVAVLDGGIQKAVENGYPTESGAPSESSSAARYPFDGWQLPTASHVDVQAAIDRGRTVVDVRSPGRFRGEHDPFEPTAGHVPGATNQPYEANLDDGGCMRQADELRALYSGLDANDVVHCGSGVTACHTLLALEHAELELPALYVGSWSEWSRRGLPIATDNP